MKSAVFFFVLGSICLLFSSCASFNRTAPNEMRTFTISLDANKTTGYSWVCEISNEKIAQVINEEYQIDYDRVDKNGICGAGGTQTFTILCKKKGYTTIKMLYRRAWEYEKPAEIRTYMLTVSSRLAYQLTETHTHPYDALDANDVAHFLYDIFK